VKEKQIKNQLKSFDKNKRKINIKFVMIDFKSRSSDIPLKSLR